MSRDVRLSDYWGKNAPALVERGSRVMLEALNAAAPLGSGQKALNIFCGAGETACRLASISKAAVVGVDPDSRNIDAARQRARAQGVGDRASFQSANPDKLPFEDGEFDLVFGDQLGALPNLVPISREWVRVCKPGGAVALYELAWTDEPSTDEKQHLANLLGSPQYTMSGYSGLFKTIGLQSVELRNLTDSVLKTVKGGFGKSLGSFGQFKFDAFRLARQHSYVNNLLKKRRLAFALVVGKKS